MTWCHQELRTQLLASAVEDAILFPFAFLKSFCWCLIHPPCETEEEKTEEFQEITEEFDKTVPFLSRKPFLGSLFVSNQCLLQYYSFLKYLRQNLSSRATYRKILGFFWLFLSLCRKQNRKDRMLYFSCLINCHFCAEIFA